jgi:hypothetical protein
MRAAQLDEAKVVLRVIEVLDLDFLPGLVADPDAVAGAGDIYDAEAGQFIKPAAAPVEGEALDALKLRLMQAVDADIAAIYNRWTRFGPEYDAREAAARAFAAERYAGTPSAWITSFAVPARLTVRDAADKIIAQADALKVGLQALGAFRMAKYGIFGAPDAAAAQQIYDDIMQGVHETEKGLP